MTTPIAAPSPLNSGFLATKTIDLQNGSVAEKRQEILNYFHTTFTLYESLFECLGSDDVFFARANTLRHPLIFYYGHTAVFFVNKLNVAGLINTRIDPLLESTLAVGVDEMSWDDLSDNCNDWPSSVAVKSYRDKTRACVDNFIRNCDFSMPIDQDSPLWIVMMGIEHERIHLETSSVLIRELPLQMLNDHPFWNSICAESSPAPDNELIGVTGGLVKLGKPIEDGFYGWDNEYGNFKDQVPAFEASKYLVSNQEFLTFVEDQGYNKKQYWDDEGWAWVTYKNAEHPVFWAKAGDTYHYRTMLQIIDMPWSWPVDITYLEAKAFCNWKSEQTGFHIRLPTEAEWCQLRALAGTDQPFWDKAPGNINLEYEKSSCPVNRHSFAEGFFDLIGNVWQWTETPIDGYDGFKVHAAYDDFSTPTFDGKHNLIKGGSWASTGNSALKNSRYAFRRHFSQHCGLRYVKGEKLRTPNMNIYEKDDVVAQYMEFHYGPDRFGAESFPVACINAVTPYVQGRPTGRALDIGCATGRSSFELAKIYDHVDAVDLSVRLITPPTNLQKIGLQRYVIPDEGELVRYNEAKLSDFEQYDSIKEKITFLQGDACNLADKFTNYDLVFAGNLIDRLYDPETFLRTMSHRIRSGGLLVIVSPYTWTEDHTMREKWLGGFKASTGETYTTLDGIKAILTPEFTMIDTPRDIPFVMRETTRSFTQGISEMTVWEKT